MLNPLVWNNTFYLGINLGIGNLLGANLIKGFLSCSPSAVFVPLSQMAAPEEIPESLLTDLTIRKTIRAVIAVAIARALVSHPKAVLADEPTAALDSQSGRDVVTLMQKLAKEQDCTLLMVTHDNRILDVADHIIYMEDEVLVRH